MIHSVTFKAVLDTNVIFPIVIRNLQDYFSKPTLNIYIILKLTILEA